MGSEPAHPEGAISPPPAARPMSRRKKRKLALVAIVIVAALVFVFWGWSSTGGSFVSVASVISDPGSYAGKTVEVRGVVSEWSGDPSDMTFGLVDIDNSSSHMQVALSGVMPAGFENGKTVVAKGTVNLDPKVSADFIASEVTVGCASKY